MIKYMFLFVIFVFGCNDSTEVFEVSRIPTSQESEVFDYIWAAWDDYPLPARSNECQEYWNRIRVVDANRNDMLKYCGFDEPGHCSPDNWTSLSKYGCAGGCASVGSECSGVGSPFYECKSYPIVVAWKGYDIETHLNLLEHEGTHLISLGLCPRVFGGNDHANPHLWGPDGIHPM